MEKCNWNGPSKSGQLNCLFNFFFFFETNLIVYYVAWIGVRDISIRFFNFILFFFFLKKINLSTYFFDDNLYPILYFFLYSIKIFVLIL
jgi:hypothetical protein